MDSQKDHTYHYVDTENALARLVRRMEKTDRICLDTEADSLHHYYEKVCLIQLTLDRVNYIVDPLKELDLTDFLRALADRPLILHGADYDLRMMRSSFSFFPTKEIFDTMLAAQLLGYERLGLAALVERFFGVVLSKKGQKADWSRRPLPKEQLDYASDDTYYLADLTDILTKELGALGRIPWHEELCIHMARSTTKDKPPPDQDRVWRFKGVQKLKSKQLTYVRELWYWRDQEAKKTDLPPFKILSNQFIIALANWASENYDVSIEQNGPKLPKNIKGARLSTLKTAIIKAKETPITHRPQPFTKRKEGFAPLSRAQVKQVDKLRDRCAQIGESLKLHPSVVCSRGALETLVRKSPEEVKSIEDLRPLMNWQANLLRTSLKEILKFDGF